MTSQTDPRELGRAFGGSPARAAETEFGGFVRRTFLDQPAVRAIYIPFPGSRRFVVDVGAGVAAEDYDTVLAQVLGHHALGHDSHAVVRVWAPASDCPFARDDVLWAIAFQHPEWTNREIVAEFNVRRLAVRGAPAARRPDKASRLPGA